MFYFNTFFLNLFIKIDIFKFLKLLEIYLKQEIFK